MGGLWFMFYDTKISRKNFELLNKFSELKSRGSDFNNIEIHQTNPINQFNRKNAVLKLSKREIQEYSQLRFYIGMNQFKLLDKTSNSNQPFTDPIFNKILENPQLRSRPNRKLICDGDIYNYKELISENDFGDTDLQSETDVEVIMPTYIKYGISECLNKLRGQFSFVITENIDTYDLKTINVFVARDPLGIKPLYMITSKKDTFYLFVSDLTGVPDDLIKNKRDYRVVEVPPGSYWSFNNSVIKKNKNEFINYFSLNKYYDLANCTKDKFESSIIQQVYSSIYNSIYDSIVYRLTGLTGKKDIFGVYCNGSFSSSVVLSLLTEYLVSINYNFYKQPVYVFTLCDKVDSENLVYSKQIVDFLKDKFGIPLRHRCIITYNSTLSQRENDFLKNIVSQDAKFYNFHNIKNYYFLSRDIYNNSPVRVLLDSRGLRDICGCPILLSMNDEEFQKESVNRLSNIPTFHEKIMMSSNISVRFPLLDEIFLETMLDIHPKLKRPYKYTIDKPPIENYIIRKAFDIQYDKKIPYDNLWRPGN
jgi:asparagine synthase (glutamine-hydrolysing)